jgi:putative transposase
MTEATMQLVEQHIIRRDDKRFVVLDRACFYAKNIYNAANYELRQTFFAQRRRVSYAEQEKHFKQKDLLPDQDLPMKVVQHVLKGLHRDWDSSAASRAEYEAHPEKFKGRPRLPHYKDKTKGRSTITFTDQAISKTALRKGEIVLSGLNVSFKTRQRNVDQVRVVPHSSHYVVEVVYSKPIAEVVLDYRLYAGLDVGVDVLAALTSNKPGFAPFLVNGRPLKALNQFYNKGRADIQSQLPEGVHSSRRLQELTFARNRRMESLLHLSSAYIIHTLLREGIGNLVIGKNDGWKQNVAMGKRTNQNFVSIPHARFIDMLTYKAKMVGIQVKVIEEGYTSKCSFLDREPIGKHEAYLGRRIKRGLFRASDGHTIQADLNGSYNIIRKVAPDAFDNLPQVATHGLRLNPKVMQKHLQMWKHNECSGANPAQCGA